MISLTGTSPQPLSHYLKALGVFRILAEQADPEARGWWEDERFHIETALHPQDVESFFLAEYRPTPLVTPWNGGSGFFGRDEALRGIEESQTQRLHLYRTTIQTARTILKEFGLEKKPDNKDKRPLVQACRNRFPDAAVAWVDAAVVLTTGDLGFPPLAGTGGNDGNLEFTNNFMQRILNVMSPKTGQPTDTGGMWLRAALWGDATPELIRGAIGQFSPGEAGGPNARSGFSGESLVNPWDYILMLEGALVFASAAAKRLEKQSRSVVSAPFTVYPTTVGYRSTAESDGAQAARAEMWMPLWRQPVSLPELLYIFREGRAQLSGDRVRRTARNGVDFARACATLAVDRGIESFQRYAFLMRSGKAYLAVPLNRFIVRRQAYAELFAELDTWLDLFARVENTSHAFQSALHRIREAEFLYCQYGGARRMQDVLVALGRAEQLLARVPSARQKVPPLVLRNPGWWRASDDGSPEFRIAGAFVSVYPGSAGSIRSFLSPVDPGHPGRWGPETDPPRVVWKHTDVAANMAAVLRRRLLETHRSVGGGENAGSAAISTDEFDKPTAGPRTVPLSLIGQFLKDPGRDARVADLIWGLLPLYRSVASDEVRSSGSPGFRFHRSMTLLPWAYVLARLISVPNAQLQRVFPGAMPLPVPDRMLSLLAAGELNRAAGVAEQRLRGSGFSSPFFRKGSVPRVNHWTAGNPQRTGTRILAALALPIADRDLRQLAQLAGLTSETGAEAAQPGILP
ncbi:MAG: type I-U CRISPR-associated protein Csx17 [Kyrpidia tusciae]|nr:type I-U CRISPR-associated protein Csx17 [Kyrpidia tusciae]MBE3552789.1 type I-U CRISPR-associated protein Csx17 [Kyrpidia tusciae]